MNKIVGTVNYLAPEVYQGETYTEKSDVYRYYYSILFNSNVLKSLSVVLWEMITRTIKGVYTSPFSEYGYKFDWQILIAVSQNNIRPSIPPTAPKSLLEIYQLTAHSDPTQRPTAQELLDKFFVIFDEYKNNTAEWDSVLEMKMTKLRESAENKAENM
jgi:serine/threonine protein kinase